MMMLYVSLLTVVLLKLTHSVNQKLINQYRPRNNTDEDSMQPLRDENYEVRSLPPWSPPTGSPPTRHPTRSPPTRHPTRSPTVPTFKYMEHEYWDGAETGDFRCTKPSIRGQPTFPPECPSRHLPTMTEMKCDRHGWCSTLKKEGEACIDVNDCDIGIHYCHPVTSTCSYGNVVGEGCSYLADDHFSECDKRRRSRHGDSLTSGCGKTNVCHGLVTSGQSCSTQYTKKENLTACSLYKYDYPDVTSGDKAAWHFFQESTTRTHVNGKYNVGKVDPICIPVKFSFQKNSLTLPSDDFVCERKHAVGEICRYATDCVATSTERTDMSPVINVRTICFRDPALKDGLVQDSHGYCHRERGIGQTCIDDDDCASQDYYEGTLQDVSGCQKNICHGTRATGSSCNFQYECDPQSNKLCFHSKCAPLREPGETCENDSQCKFSACRLGKCLILKKLGETCTRAVECGAGAGGCYFSPETKQRLCLTNEPGKPGNTLTSESTKNVLEWIAESTLRDVTAGYCYRPPAQGLRCGKKQVQVAFNCYNECDSGDVGIGALCMCGLFCYYGRVPGNYDHAWIWTCDGLDNHYSDAGMCYHECPPTHSFRCGVGCTVDGDTCVSSTVDMVIAPLGVVANIVTLGGSSVAMKAFDFAVTGTMAVYTVIKANLDEIYNYASSGSAEDLGWPDWVIWELHQAGCGATTACQRSLIKKYATAMALSKVQASLETDNYDFIDELAALPQKKEYQMGDFYTMNMMSITDPTSLVGVLTAYAKPDCWYPPKLAPLIVFN